MGRESYLIR